MLTKKIWITTVILIMTAFALLPVYSQNKTGNKVKPIGYLVRPMNERDLIGLIHQYAVNWGIEPRLFENLIRKEGGGICKNSPKGARGIAQLMPNTARRLGLRVDTQVDERCDLLKSLNAGARYLRFQFDLFKDVRLALAGYNAGEGAVIKFGYLIPPYQETIKYVETICVWTYGRTGMALEKAFNYNTAVRYVSEVYRNQRMIVPALNVPPSVAQTPPENQTIAGQIAPNVNLSENTSASESKEKKEIRKVVRVNDLEPRLSTNSLFFNKKE